MADRSDVATLERERDLYRSLLELSEADNDVSGLLHGILDIVRELTGADQLYLQAGADLEAAPAYWAAIGTSTIDVDVARAHLSRSIVREALVGGGVVETACALTDERFDGAESVKANRVGAVICAAVGGDPELGLLYVQGARGGAGLRRDAARIVGTTARVVASGVERQVLRAEEARRGDATEAIRARFAADEFVGHSPALIPVLELASLAAGSDAPVLLTGPSGTGKSLLARVIAKSGARRDAPFVEVNCAALPGALIESELFGASRGAHSTAMDARPGLVSSAEGGTLFFDEITELPMFAQAKLLHLTQTGTYYRLGDDAPRRANVRVIAATNADLESPDAERQLRRDLYYRLAVVKINLPGLDERNDDVALLARELASRIAEQLGMRHAKIASDAISLLQRRRWPGHIRELRNVLELGLLRARAEGTNVVRAGHVENPTQTTRDETPSTLQERTRRFQRDVIESALSEAGGRTAVAAEILGLSRSHLYHLITTLSVNRAPNGRDD